MLDKLEQARETLVLCRENFGKIIKQNKSGQHCICNDSAKASTEALALLDACIAEAKGEEKHCDTCGKYGTCVRAYGINFCTNWQAK